MQQGARTPLIAGNWKMNGTRDMARALVAAVAEAIPEGVEMAVIPPAPYLALAVEAATGSPLAIGAQDLSQHAEGAYTGEVSAAMLVDVGVSHVLVGHSERRQYHQESDALVAAKFEAARRAGLIPVLCRGETLAARESGITETVVGRQLDVVIEACGIQTFAEAVIAYEPIWAIGTGRTASPEQAQQVHALIRHRVAERNATIAGRIRILYGGSMKPTNAADLVSREDIDGGLIGGASLAAEDFLAIAHAAARV